jgi:biotin synthase
MSIVALKDTQKHDAPGMTELRHDWRMEEIIALFEMPLNDLIFKAQQVHRQHFDANEVQISTLLSIKTGGCPEDCKYCPQSARYNTGVDAEKLMDAEVIVSKAQQAKDAGASRFCMGAAWRELKERDVVRLARIIEGVKGLELETCMTLGMLTKEQADALRDAGLDYYNHNIDSSEDYYKEIISTRTYDERLETLKNVRESGMKVCSGGIVGMGERREDRAGMLQTLANLPSHPQSVPINMLVKVEGTPLDDVEELDPFEFIRTIAIARIMMPASAVRLSAGREQMSDETQAMCFLAGANSIFYGEKLLTTGNPEAQKDRKLFERLGIRPMQ